MINRIEIKNFQSHKNTVIDFKPGVNVFLGESDNGKTAVIRAIRWVVWNRPLGTDKLNSSWNGKFSEDMSVKLTLDDGTWVERVRNNSLNGYRYCRSGDCVVTLEATGTDVPQIVSDITRLGEVNFQFQMDPPYLLSMSSSEVSRYFNGVVHLDVIDKTLSVAESDRRALNSELKVVQADVEKYAREIEKLGWLDEAEDILKRMDRYDEILDKKGRESAGLEKDILSFMTIASDVQDYSGHDAIVREIESIVIGDASTLESSVAEYDSAASDVRDYSRHHEIIKEIESIVIADASALESSVAEYVFCEESIHKYESMLKTLFGALPDVCPICGSVLDKNNFRGC